jgi:hypothetical protein
MEKEIKSFEDLVFKAHANKMEGAVQALHELPNGIMISIIGGQGFYGNGQSSFEMAAWHKGNPEFIMLSENDEILGWQSKEEIEETIQKILNMEIIG